jgi:hypothetical protein
MVGVEPYRDSIVRTHDFSAAVVHTNTYNMYWTTILDSGAPVLLIILYYTSLRKMSATLVFRMVGVEPHRDSIVRTNDISVLHY